MPSPTALFEGTTTALPRSVVADLYATALPRPERVVLPCVGRYAALLALRSRGCPSEIIEASDVSLFSSIIGYLADPAHDLDELPVNEYPIAEFVADVDGPYDRAAGWMLAVKYHQLPATNLHAASIRQSIRHDLAPMRATLAEAVEANVQQIGPIRYDIVDVRRVVDLYEHTETPTFLFVNLPGYKQGYTKQYGHAEALLGYPHTIALDFDPEEIPGLLRRLSENPTLYAATYVQGGYRGLDELDGWHRVGGLEKRNRTDYVLATRPESLVKVEPLNRHGGPKRRLRIYDDEEITPDSDLRFVPTDRDTCLFYRDLFVHRLGATQATSYHLMLIDDRVTTALGLFPDDLRMGWAGQTLGDRKPGEGYLFETFGITRTSDRYARLGKLFMLALTSADFRTYAVHTLGLGFQDPTGIMTTSITKYREGKTDRSVMKRAIVEERDDGQFRIVYEAPFREESYSDVLRRWLHRWGDISRPGWTP